jgi:hypothetical protein
MGHPADTPRERCRLRKGSRSLASLSANQDAATIASFLSDQTQKGEASHIEAIDLRRMLKTYCKDRPLAVPSTRRFGAA